MDPLTILAIAAEAVQYSEMQTHLLPFGVRRARPSDIPFLDRVEKSAAEVFRKVGLDFLLDGPTVDPRYLIANLSHLWVAVEELDRPIGFVVGENLFGNFHIVEISVAQAFQGKGIGRALIARMAEEVKLEGYKAVTLMTYRDVPWNGPWYAKMGFTEVNPVNMGSKYLEILQMEGQHGHDLSRRALMMRIL